jgi:hypothetical protein
MSPKGTLSLSHLRGAMTLGRLRPRCWASEAGCSEALKPNSPPRKQAEAMETDYCVNFITTISESDVRRMGGPQVPVPEEV